MKDKWVNCQNKSHYCFEPSAIQGKTQKLFDNEMLQQFDFICSTRRFWDILKTFVWVSQKYSQLTLEMVQKKWMCDNWAVQIHNKRHATDKAEAGRKVC